MPSFFNSWFPFIYLYGLGGLFFFIGIYIARKSGALDLSIKRHRFWYKVMLYGYFYFVIMHASLTLAALYL